METTLPDHGRKENFLFSLVFIFRFIFPVVVGGLAFYFGFTSENVLPLGWTLALLTAFPLVVFLFFPILVKITGLSKSLEKLPVWLNLGSEWLVLCVYTWLLGIGFLINHSGISQQNIWKVMWTAFLFLSVIFVLLYITRSLWGNFLPVLQSWEGRLRLINLGIMIFSILWGFFAKTAAPAFFSIILLVIMGLCLGLTLFRLCREREKGESFFHEVSGFVFLGFGFFMLLFSGR